MRKDERTVIGEKAAESEHENAVPNSGKDETGVERRKDEAGAKRRKDEAEIDRRKNEVEVDRRKDETGAEKGKDESRAERFDERKSVEDGDELVNTPYDDVYRTMINDASELILPVLNEIFGEHYDGTEKIVFTKDTHILNRQDGRGKRRTTDSSFAVIGRMTNYYLVELQSRPDSSLLIRFFEYGTQIALDEGQMEGNVLKVRIPNCAVLYLRSTRNTPDQMQVQLTTPGGDVTFPVLVMKVQRYTLKDIFEKRLYFLIPFYIFSHEKSFPEYEADEEKLELLKKEYVTIMNRLETLEQEGQINAYNRSLIMEMSGVVLRHIAAKYDRVKSEVKRVMGGRVLEYEAKKIREEERKKSEEQLKKSEERRIGGIVESVRSMMKELQLSADRSMTILKVSEEDWELVKSLV